MLLVKTWISHFLSHDDDKVLFFYRFMTNRYLRLSNQRDMKKAFIIITLSVSSILLAQCTPKAAKAIAAAPAPTAASDPAATAASAQQLESGKMMFAGNCAKCHGLKAPETRTPEQWEKILKRMIPKAKLSEEDGKLVKAYIMAHAKQG